MWACAYETISEDGSSDTNLYHKCYYSFSINVFQELYFLDYEHWDSSCMYINFTWYVK
jgi:hypothetical protein